MKPICLGACMLLCVSVWGAELPEFSAAGIVRGSQPAKMLTPGAFLSIYGRYLSGPPGTCTGKLRGSDYPAELCGTQVLIGGRPAGLLYVSGTQINFKVPLDVPESDRMEVRVTHNGDSSLPVVLRSGIEKTTLAVQQPALAGLPVWLKVELPFELGSLSYPYILGDAGFGCTEVEVRRNGVTLPLKAGANRALFGGVFSGNACGSLSPMATPYAGRLPIHLLYQLDAPGSYEARFTLWTSPAGMRTGPHVQMRTRSEWIPFDLQPSTPNQRAEWMEALRRGAGNEPARVLGDLLPNLLAVVDNASLDMLCDYLYDPNEAVRRYAMNGLAYWPAEAATRKLTELLRSRGPSDVLVRHLMRQAAAGGVQSERAAELLAASLPYLNSPSPVLLTGALEAVRQGPRDSPTVLEALLQAAEHIEQYADGQTTASFVQMLAETRSEAAHPTIRKLAEAGRDYAMSPLASFGDINDLPLLAAFLERGGADDRLAYLPETLYARYGSAVVPYLVRALDSSSGRFTTRNIAMQLMLAGHPAGFQFAARALARTDVSRIDLLQALKARFAELSTASDEQVIAFVKQRTERQTP